MKCAPKKTFSQDEDEEDAWCVGKGRAATVHVNEKAQYQTTVLGGYLFFSMQTEKDENY